MEYADKFADEFDDEPVFVDVRGVSGRGDWYGAFLHRRGVHMLIGTKTRKLSVAIDRGRDYAERYELPFHDGWYMA